MEAIPYLPFIETVLLLMPSFLRQVSGLPYHVHAGFPMQHHSDVLISSPLLILPFFTVVEYEYDISVEHVYYNSRIPFCNVNTTSETVAVCFWMLKDFQAQALNCKFSKPSM